MTDASITEPVGTKPTSSPSRGRTRLRVPLSFRRVGALAVWILAAVLGLTSFLNYANFERAYLDLVRSRSEVLAQDVRQAVEYGLNLGLRLEEMTQLPELLAETQGSDSDIRWAMVVNSQGKPVFSSPEGAATDVGQIKPYGMQSDGESYFTYTPVVNSFGRGSGAVVIAWSRELVDSKLIYVLAALLRHLAIVLTAFAALLFVAAWVQGRQFARREELLREVLEGNEAAGRHGEDPVEADVNRLAGATREVMEEIVRLDALLDRQLTQPARQQSLREEVSP